MTTQPPTEDELVGSGAGLDGPYVSEHFLGKTQAEARKMFAECGLLYTEDFSYMAAGGLRYYLPPALEHLRDEEYPHNSDFPNGLLCSLMCQVCFSGQLPPTDVLSLMKDIAKYVDTHREKFRIKEKDYLTDDYIQKIEAA